MRPLLKETMFNRKREITELEKTEIIWDHLNDELVVLCAITDNRIQDVVNIRIRYIQDSLDFQSKKLKCLRTGIKK